MQFQTSYYNTMDRGYYIAPSEVAESQLTPTPNPKEVISKLGPQQIGFGSNPFQHPIQAIGARIKEGVGYIDIPFFGAGKGNKERYTPESISKKERRDIRELAEMNKVKLSTHASTNIQGLAGFNGREGFNDQVREQTLKEIKKAVDFASDLQGGAIVFHTGEWERPFTESDWNKNNMFVNYPEEKDKAIIHMVDDRTGEVIGSVRKSVLVHEPIYEEDGNGNWIDFRGNFISKDTTDPETLLRRKPVWDKDNDQFETRELKWDDFVQRANEARAKGENTSPEYEYMKSRMQEQLLRSRGSSLFYSQGYEDSLEEREALQNALDFYEKLEANVSEEDKWKLLQTHNPAAYSTIRNLVPDSTKMPTELLKDRLTNVERRIKHVHEASAAADVEAKNTADRLDHIKPIAEYGIDKSADTVARAAEFAWQKSAHKKSKDPNFRDIFVSPESYLPNQFGSHPDEIRELIDTSREQFAKIMKDKHRLSDSEAKKLAETHIKGTLDTGHFNMWRQHFEAKPGESKEQADKRFNDWYVNEFKSLVESGRVGQIHLTDNMGFDDEHLTPGEGTVPMKEVMKIVEDSGVKDIIVEAGSFNAATVVPETFERFGSPVYSIGRGPSFAQFHQQSFGYDAPPFYMVGAYAPGADWRLWSDVQLE